MVNGLNAVLVLEDGSVLLGKGFGFPKTVVGEVVFTTGMVGYPESITDPSYRGQILCFTYPLIGNYGVPSPNIKDKWNIPLHFESDRPHVLGIIVHELCERPSHWSNTETLHEWLFKEGVPGIAGIDTRSLTKRLRIKGVMMGALEVSEGDIDTYKLFSLLEKAPRYDHLDLVGEVTVKEPIIYDNEGPTVVIVDCGVKYGIVRSLLRRGLRVIRVPCDWSADKILDLEPKGVVISNGPGNPEVNIKTIKTIKDLVEVGIPMLGICLGNQMIALALGASTFKLKFGHRGQNKPCIDLESGRCYVTSQNHGFAVREDTLKDSGLSIWFLNADDMTIEGIKHRRKPIIAAQFHPEASPGPYDTEYIFDLFINIMGVNNS
ncbi:MAG: glutamine-hydrolyzing carbamoyl-phosphate synthase small subunit [Candidatus Nezhaarchaeota archaeon]|nr:glutamine-hydrolyzing carbamoyl-phosphate synthase small subunit [Candidatus Nezhaarchaeota archaeon]MCX8141472.1 glutamine-hydrolyzing carbamoyl-phosphate synthase small subunit [Candidatus Nezhaarchaeota archaeon]MDW8049738.1 glutamine-hydrolyzing carbamoyl-phosphate synthase small subunit [Nitrososphaerota archaeon]